MATEDPTRSPVALPVSSNPRSSRALAFFTERTLAAYLAVSDRTIRKPLSSYKQFSNNGVPTAPQTYPLSKTLRLPFPGYRGKG